MAIRISYRKPAGIIWVILTVNGEWIRIVRINWQSDGRAENPSLILSGNPKSPCRFALVLEHRRSSCSGAAEALEPQVHLSFTCLPNGVREPASTAGAIGLRGCLHLLLRAEMTAPAFGFLLSL
jgi:hypothetical protein